MPSDPLDILSPFDSAAVGRYEKKYIAYLDVLGFSALVRRIEDDERAFYDALAAIDGAEAVGPGLTGCVRVTGFSDSVVVTGAHLADVASYARATQLTVLWFGGLPVRGGIAQGRIYHEGRIVLGQGLLDAYRLESEVARNPRIVLAQELVDEESADVPGFDFRKDTDGQTFLWPFRSEDVQADRTAGGGLTRGRLKAGLADAIRSLDDGRVEKWKWLVLRFNETIEKCRSRGMNVQSPIDPRSPSRSPENS